MRAPVEASSRVRVPLGGVQESAAKNRAEGSISETAKPRIPPNTVVCHERWPRARRCHDAHAIEAGREAADPPRVHGDRGRGGRGRGARRPRPGAGADEADAADRPRRQRPKPRSAHQCPAVRSPRVVHLVRAAHRRRRPRQFLSGAGAVVGGWIDGARRHLPPPSRRRVPRRDAVYRGGCEVQHRADPGSGHRLRAPRAVRGHHPGCSRRGRRHGAVLPGAALPAAALRDDRSARTHGVVGRHVEVRKGLRAQSGGNGAVQVRVVDPGQPRDRGTKSALLEREGHQVGPDDFSRFPGARGRGRPASRGPGGRRGPRGSPRGGRAGLPKGQRVPGGPEPGIRLVRDPDEGGRAPVRQPGPAAGDHVRDRPRADRQGHLSRPGQGDGQVLSRRMVGRPALQRARVRSGSGAAEAQGLRVSRPADAPPPVRAELHGAARGDGPGADAGDRPARHHPPGERAGLYPMVLRGEIPFSIPATWTPRPDPNGLAYILWDSRGYANTSHYHNPQVDKLLDAGAVTYDLNERTKLYRQAERLIVDDAPYVFYYASPDYAIMRRGVQGFRYGFDLIPRVAGAWRWGVRAVPAMWRYVLRRTLVLIPTVALVSFGIFVLMRTAVGGDPTLYLLGHEATLREG